VINSKSQGSVVKQNSINGDHGGQSWTLVHFWNPTTEVFTDPTQPIMTFDIIEKIFNNRHYRSHFIHVNCPCGTGSSFWPLEQDLVTWWAVRQMTMKCRYANRQFAPKKISLVKSQSNRIQPIDGPTMSNCYGSSNNGRPLWQHLSCDLEIWPWHWPSNFT